MALGAALGLAVGLLWLGHPLTCVTVGIIVGLLLDGLSNEAPTLTPPDV